MKYIPLGNTVNFYALQHLEVTNSVLPNQHFGQFIQYLDTGLFASLNDVLCPFIVYFIEEFPVLA